VVLRTVAGHPTGESAADLGTWLAHLDGCPTVNRALPLECENPSHGDEPATWFYVEADATESIARRRCLSCGTSRDSFDSGEHWTAPRMWSCPTCGQSIAEVSAGLHVEDDEVTWVALAVRCVECGTIAGVTDFNLDPTSVDEVAAQA
jgi:ferredoxin-like protein FixX